MTNIEVKSNSKKEKLNIYNSMDFKSMRKAGYLAAETLDFITKYVEPGITTEKLDSLYIYWPDGTKEIFNNINGGQEINIIEGQGRLAVQ